MRWSLRLDLAWSLPRLVRSASGSFRHPSRLVVGRVVTLDPARPTAPGLANRARLRRPTLSDLGGRVRPPGVHPAHRHTSIISAARMVPAISGDPPPRTLAHLNQ